MYVGGYAMAVVYDKIQSRMSYEYLIHTAKYLAVSVNYMHH